MSDSQSKLSDDELIELALLRDFEIDALIAEHFLSLDDQLSRPLDRELVLDFGEVNLTVTAGPTYPASSVVWCIENRVLSRISVDALRKKLRDIVEAAKATNNLTRWQNREVEFEMGVFNPVQVVLFLARTTREHISGTSDTSPQQPTCVSPKEPGIESDNYLPFFTRPSEPVDKSTAAELANTTAFRLLGKTPQQICASIPPDYRVVHIESVLRGNLVAAFEDKQDELRDVLSGQRRGQLQHFVPAPYNKERQTGLVNYLVSPRLTFHGTSREYVSSIIRYGFLLPGSKDPKTRKAHAIRCGSTYGQGIYSSPDPKFAISYSNWVCPTVESHEFFGMNLLVCATC